MLLFIFLQVEEVLTHQNTIMKSSGDLQSTLKRSYSDIKLNDDAEGHIKELHGSRPKLHCEESEESSVDVPLMKKASLAKMSEVSELSSPCSEVDVVGDERDNADNDGVDDVPSKPKPSKLRSKLPNFKVQENNNFPKHTVYILLFLHLIFLPNCVVLHLFSL